LSVITNTYLYSQITDVLQYKQIAWNKFRPLFTT